MLVSNASTLILLAKVAMLRPFLKVKKHIALPRVVFTEIMAKENSFEVLSIKKEIEQKRIVLFDVNQEQYAPIQEQFRLDDGEAAAYCLCKQKNRQAILTDDRELIKLCKIEEIPFICAMAVVVRLYQQKNITKRAALAALDKLQQHGWYSKKLYEYFKEHVK